MRTTTGRLVKYPDDEVQQPADEREAFQQKIQSAFPNLVQEHMAAMKAKGSPLTPDEMKQLNAELVERSKAIAAGLRRLSELGVGRERLEEIVEAGPEGALERIQAAIAEAEGRGSAS